jgi:hypothetical protein
VLKESITTYCVVYDPYYCRVDPERIWGLIQDRGGAAHVGAVGRIHFYVPQQFITQILLMESGLIVKQRDSYI